MVYLLVSYSYLLLRFLNFFFLNAVVKDVQINPNEPSLALFYLKKDNQAVFSL